MKFDKLMEHLYKVMCIALACLVLVGSVVSCFRPIRAKAESSLLPDWYWEILGEQTQIYWDTYKTKRELIAPAVSDALIGTGHHRDEVQDIVSLQDQLLYFYLNFYNQYIEDTDNLPDTVTVEGSANCGIYTSRLDNKKHVATSSFISGDGCFVGSDEFAVSVSAPYNGYYGGHFISTNSGTNGGYIYETYYDPYSRSTAITISDSGGYFTSDYVYNQPSNQRDGRWAAFSGSQDFVLPANLLLSYSSNNVLNFGGYGSTITLPSGTVDFPSPWDYYNRYLLPYIRQNFDIDDIDNFLIFPNGYTPGQDPFEPDYLNPNINFNGVGVGGAIPIVIGAGAVINIMGNDINVFAPVKGQINIDGIQLQFPVGNTNIVYIDGDSFDIPTSELAFDDHSLEILENTKFLLDGIQFLINSDGSLTVDNTTYSLPIGQPVTLATGDNYLVYKYQIPTMEKLNIVDADLEAVDLSSFSNGFSVLWALVEKFYTDTGLMTALIACLGLSAVGFFVAKIGGH